ncbi:hypothetical protein PR048_025687 [Dryococelus australis]|uniref:Mutator-like transposase domain-containing protein n=1 Tax=Dryococelus australis TaxID=614101 RepID=A0ABQ9GJA2_9NEOP|nr:hypothetical protein PR048_025687 [Dryococelus australis]
MEKAAKDEAVNVVIRECGDVGKEGFPLVTVISDYMWGKGSYRNKYNSMSGTVGIGIAGYRTKKVLHLEVRNKYCAICDREHRKSNIPPHKCYNRWTGPSTAKEADGIVAGLTKSIPLHGLKYARLFNDGDSSVHKKQNEYLPYGPDVLVAKIEFRNHILRNYADRLLELSLNKTIGTV